VSAVEPRGPADRVAMRLEDLGFVPGEVLRVISLGPIGGDPMVVQVGFTRFALRRSEAARVLVTESDAEPA
jgi:ferrous iron transport protein A